MEKLMLVDIFDQIVWMQEKEISDDSINESKYYTIAKRSEIIIITTNQC